MKKSVETKILVGIIALLTIFIAVTVLLTINSVSTMHKNTMSVTSHPFSISHSIFKIRNNISESKVRLSRIVMYRSDEDLEIVLHALDALHTEIADEAAHVLEKYSGNENDIKRLQIACEQLKQKHYALLDRARELSSDEIQGFITVEIDPQSQAADAAISTIQAYVQNSVVRLSQDSANALNTTIMLCVSLLVGVALVCVIVMRMLRQQDKEQNFNRLMLDSLADNIDDFFIIYSSDRKEVEYVLPNSKRVLGLEPSSIMQGLDDIRRRFGETGEEIAAAISAHTLRSKVDREYLYKNPETGSNIWVSISVYPIKEDKKNRYIFWFSDTTASRRNREALNDALMSAQTANSAKSDFLSHMSHEIRTPINAIIGMTTIAASAINNPARVEDCLGKISRSSNHLLTLINDVLDMSKIESGKLVIVNESFDLPEALRNVIAIIFPQTQAKEQKLEVSMGSLVNEILIGDALRLHQILLNLMSNAVKYTPRGGLIRLVIREMQGRNENIVRLRFIISDTGIGMTEEFLQKLFVPFEQEERTVSTRSGSTGIGMAITKNLVSLLGGTINVTSAVDKGSSFVVDLPFEACDAGNQQKFTQELSKLRVLIIDDDQITCEHTSLILGRIGISADWVTEGSSAVEKIINGENDGKPYDVAFIDWKMPSMDGLQVTKEIRKHAGEDVLIIIVSAYEWPEIEETARQAGANGFIAKPMSRSTIFNTLVSAAKQLGESQSGSIRPQPAENKAVQSIRIDDQKKDLTGKRFLVVEDNDINLEIVVELLEQAGAETIQAGNGKEACDKMITAAPGYFDMILMDIQMPVMDGYQASVAIRSSNHPDARRVPIIALTANAFAEDVFLAKDAGMNAHISKPIDVRGFYEVIYKYL